MFESEKKKLEDNNFKVTVVEDVKEVLPLVSEIISSGSTVAYGGSETIKELGLLDYLRGRDDIKFIDRDNREDRYEAMIESFASDYYLMSTNALVAEGFLYNVDGNGNRVAALTFGPKNVLVFAGKNKIVRDLGSAFRRVEEIAGPKNCKRLDKKTPCIKRGYCLNCKSPDRICSSYVTTRRSQTPGRIHIIIINEDLGY